MDLTTLNLSEEIMTQLEGHINEITTGAITKATQAETDKVRTEYSKKMKAIEDELIKYKPIDKSESEIAMEAREKVIADREKELQGKEKMLNVTNKLQSEGLPSQLAKYLQGVEDYETEVTSLKELFNTLKIDSSFKPSDHKKNDGVTKEQFKSMNYSQRTELFNKNPELYNILSK